MRTTARIAIFLSFILVIAGAACGAEPLTLDGALAIARERAPAIVAERLRLEEARAHAASKNRFATSNPEFEASMGWRDSDGAASHDRDWEMALSQSFSDLVRGPARSEVALARLDADTRSLDDATRTALLEVAAACVERIALQRQGALAADSLDIASRTREAAERRFVAGDVAQLDVNVARMLHARASAELASAAAALAQSRARLGSLLGFEPGEPLEIVPDLSLPDLVADVGLEALVAARPDVRRLDAELTMTRAELRLASPGRALDWGLVAVIAEEEGDRITTAGIRFALPFADRGQFERSEASARLARLEHERASLVRAASGEILAAREAYSQLRESAASMTATLLPLLDENDALALESYDAGQIGIAELAVVRRESLDAYHAFIAHWLDARLAGLRLRFVSGELQ
ncbi:MAG: TolC family protein [Thermoanaerobaculia bacterium]